MKLVLAVSRRVSLLCCAFGIAISSVFAHGGDTDVRTLLRADGTLDLTTGFSGSLSFEDFSVVLDGKKGPVFVPKAAAGAMADAWSDVRNGINGPCYAIAVSGTNVYVGGSFTTADTSSVRNIARWNGVNWSRMGSGLFGECHALVALTNGDVIAGGTFTRAGSVTANNIARFTNANNTWSALGTGLNSSCYALALNTAQSTVYAGGLFTRAGTVAANFVAACAIGSGTWSAFQTGLNGPCYAITTLGSTEIVVGGNFNMAGTVTANNIARWTGSAWAAVGTGLNGICYALVTGANNEVFVGGSFSTAGGLPANNIARFVGTTWNALGAGLDGPCYALARNGSWLYAGGAFTTAGGLSANRAARWDNTIWSPLGTGLDDECYALGVLSTGVYAGGRFLEAGGNPVSRVAFSIGCNPALIDYIDSQALCHGFTTNAVNLSGTAPTLGNYFWANTEPSIGIPSTGFGNIPPFVAQNINVIPTEAKIRVTPITGPPLAYVTNTQGNSITVVNVATNTVVTTLTATSPRGVAVSPATPAVFVANQSNTQRTFSIFDAATNTLTRTGRTGFTNTPNASGIAVNAIGTTVYITNPSENGITVSDVSGDTVISRIRVGTAPIGVAVTPDSNMVYVANNGSDNVSVIHPVLLQVVATIPVGADPLGIAVTPNGKFVYVANEGSGTVSVISATTYEVVDEITVGTAPSGVAINPAGTRVYVTNRGSNTVSVINTATNTVIGTINLSASGRNPIGVSVSPDGTRVVVANNGTFSPTPVINASISIINAVTNTVITDIVVGPSAGSYALGNFISLGSCYGNPQEFGITVYPKLRLSLEKDTIICRGDTVRLQANGTGVGFRWSPRQSLSDSVGQAVLAYPKVTTDYVVRAGNTYGCEGSDTVRVSVHQPQTLKCKPQVTVYLDGSGRAVLQPGQLLDNTPPFFREKYQIIAYSSAWKIIWDTLTCEQLEEITEVHVTDLCTYQTCITKVLLKDTLKPVVNCRPVFAACVLGAYDPYFLRDSLKLPDAFPATDNCKIVSAEWTDGPITDRPCNFSVLDAAGKQRFSSATFPRNWVFRDASGNEQTCTQTIHFERKRVYEILFPKDTVVTCDWEKYQFNDPNLTPYFVLGGRRFYLYKSIMGLDDCGFTLDYTEQTFPEANGIVRILRKWTVRDTCASTGAFSQPVPYTNPRFHVQVINVVPDLGLRAKCPREYVVSTDSAGCCGRPNLPDLVVEDYCSRVTEIKAIVTTRDFLGRELAVYNIPTQLSDFPLNNPDLPDTLAVVGRTPCLKKGEHDVVYTVLNDRGTSLTCAFKLRIIDFKPPVAVCDKQTVVSLGNDDLQDCYLPDPSKKRGAGVAWLKAKDLDDGTHDECAAPFAFTVRRMAPYSAFIESLNKQQGMPPCTGSGTNNPTEYERATAEQDSIKFYCDELGTSQTIIVRVYQLEPWGTKALDTLGNPIFSECMVQVDVQDKLPPRCSAPAPVTVNCENFDPSLWAYGEPSFTDNCCIGNIVRWVDYTAFDTACNRGTLTRRFSVEDCSQNTAYCIQRVVVESEQDYAVRFPDDRIITICGGNNTGHGAPSFFGEDCELMAVSFRDDTLAALADTCYKIERTWKIINWCSYDPNLPLTFVPNPEPRATPGHADNLRGPTVAPPNTAAPWNPTRTPLTPSGAVFDYGSLWDPNTNGYLYKQIIKVAERQAPIIHCLPIDTCDVGTNAPLLWNDLIWWDKTLQTHDLCEAPVEAAIDVSDACTGADLQVRFLLYLDLDGNGTTETLVSSAQQPQPGTVMFGNRQGAGTPVRFDHRNVPVDQLYRFAIQTTKVGDTLRAVLRWNTTAEPGKFVQPQLPYGRHRLEWIATDACGNDAACHRDFLLKDCKPPTVVCKPLSVNMMPTGMIALWASDFLEYAADNCTPAQYLSFSVERDLTPPNGFPLQNGQPIRQVSFTCADLGAQVVRLWARDTAGNADFCQSYVLVQANNVCTPKATVAGRLTTNKGEGVEEVSITLRNTHPAFPPAAYYDLTDAQGNYTFSQAVPLHSSCTITPRRDDNPLNGVTTLDLALITKHVLGNTALSSPYLIIAADANRSGTITMFDVVELRKLILGIYDTLPNNRSWRFVEKNFVFPNPSNPFQTPFREYIEKSDVQGYSNPDEHFMGIKVGDVNGTAQANQLMAAEERTQQTFYLELPDQTVAAREIFEVALRTGSPAEAFQYTLQFPDLELLEVQPQAPLTTEHFAKFHGQLTCAWNAPLSYPASTTVLLRFRALKGGALRDLVRLSNRITRSEGYAPYTGERLGLALRFVGKQRTQEQQPAFEVFQNTPNPAVGFTSVGFFLPQPGQVHLVLRDALGRTVTTRSEYFSAGLQQFRLDAASLPSGMYFYTVTTTRGDSGTGKMEKK